MADAPSHQRGLGTTPTPANPRTGTLEQELSLSLSLTTPSFCPKGPRLIRIKGSAGSRAPPRSLLHLSSRCFEKGLVRGRSSSLTESHRASTNQERAAPPLPLLTKRNDYPAGDSGGRNSGGRFRWEIQAGEILPGPAGAIAAATPLPSPVPRRSWPRGACKMAFVGREVAKMVVGNVSKVASWCEWRGC